MDDYDVIETSDDEQYRVVLVRDVDCEQPMTSGDWWTASVLTSTYTSRLGATMEAMYDPEDRFSAWEHFADSTNPATPEADEAFKRYMRIFHDIEVFDVSVHNGYRDVSNALAWLEPSERERINLPETYPAKDVLDTEISEHNRWADGECYGYIVQKRVTWTADSPEFEDRDEWENTGDSCWGLIGREYAEQEATEALATYGRSAFS
jgi:hypothetical protein